MVYNNTLESCKITHGFRPTHKWEYYVFQWHLAISTLIGLFRQGSCPFEGGSTFVL